MVAIYDGERESKLSWKTVLQDLKSKGLKQGPKLSVGDGALGLWAALEEEFPGCAQQRCWVHKTANILDKMPKSVQVDTKSMIHNMYMSPTTEEGIKAMNRFISLYEAKYPKACKCLTKDEDQLFTFYDYPAQHWQHTRTTNPIESTFATIRHRSRQTKGCGSRIATLSMEFPYMSFYSFSKVINRILYFLGFINCLLKISGVKKVKKIPICARLLKH